MAFSVRRTGKVDSNKFVLQQQKSRYKFIDDTNYSITDVSDDEIVFKYNKKSIDGDTNYERALYLIQNTMSVGDIMTRGSLYSLDIPPTTMNRVMKGLCDNGVLQKLKKTKGEYKVIMKFENMDVGE